MPDCRAQLRTKLLRELAQHERTTRIEAYWEAGRLGNAPPAAKLLAIVRHTAELEPVMRWFGGVRPPIGRRLGRAIAAVYCMLRHMVLERLVDLERSYRATLVDLRRGLDIIQLLREVAACQRDAPLLAVCDALLVERGWLIDEAEFSLAWFAERPEIAISGRLRRALPAGSH